MQYDNIQKGYFVSRPNRFIAHVRLAVGHDMESFVVCHVKNTGRCKELLIPGAIVYVQGCDKPTRKTQFDLIAVEKIGMQDTPGSVRLKLINMDAQAPNAVFCEWARAGHFIPGLTMLRPEKTWGNSRFDFYWEAKGNRRGFVEVKGVTLEQEGHAFFPDAPTERGVKHLEELVACHAAGYEAAVCFVIQMAGVTKFSPNDCTHPAFGAALRQAAEAGVEVMARVCTVTHDSLVMGDAVPVVL